jgi:hypothetical protein
MKKCLVFILAIIVAVGSAFPCCIEDNCQDETLSSAVSPVESEEEACSPFFSCGGCSGFVQITKPIIVPKIITQKPKHCEGIAAFLYSDYYSSFFQPPRIS